MEKNNEKLFIFSSAPPKGFGILDATDEMI